MEKNFEEVAIITGASGNLGAATARAFQLRGYKTVLVDRASDRLPRMFQDVSKSPDHILAGGIELDHPGPMEKLTADILGKFGRIDVLVNTVGAWRGGKPLYETNLEDWDFLFAANARSVVVSCRAVIPAMIQRRRGRIINVASRDGLKGGAGYAAYSASKSAVVRLTESLAEELKSWDITANCILPSTIDTPQNRAAIPGADFTKWVEPAALADVILFLASDAARAVTGAALPVFGKS